MNKRMTEEEFNREFPPPHPSHLIYLTAEDVIPSHKLMDYWASLHDGDSPEWVIRHVATAAAQWAADRELEMCAIYLDSSPAEKTAEDLVVARRIDLERANQQELADLRCIGTPEALLQYNRKLKIMEHTNSWSTQ